MSGAKRQMRRRLDDRFNAARSIPPRPHRGWLRAVRESLGMSTAELAARLDVSQQSASEFERSEVRETIKLDTLRRAAAALDCELVYALVPRTTLEQAVSDRARDKARALLEPVAHHSRLEDQSVDAGDTDAQLEELAARLVDKRGLWSEV